MVASVTRLGTLTGSLRAESYSRRVALAVADLIPEDARISELPSVGLLPHFDQDLLADGVPQSVANLSQALAEQDGLVLVSPEYNWSIPGVLKNALDWLSRLHPMPLKDLPVLIVTASPGLLGGARAHAPIRNVLHSLDCRILARPEIQIARVPEKLAVDTPRISDPQTAAFLRERLQAFVEFVHVQRGRPG
ncbi:MAG: NADPH-dependent FMN reductase [Paracoccus sp. (in: a-proteobacteria)]|nr:NADPH-dependent FMN reductase [Paracoccus sp. (in: a-proteobacteria)]